MAAAEFVTEAVTRAATASMHSEASGRQASARVLMKRGAESAGTLASTTSMAW